MSLHKLEAFSRAGEAKYTHNENLAWLSLEPRILRAWAWAPPTLFLARNKTRPHYVVWGRCWRTHGAPRLPCAPRLPGAPHLPGALRLPGAPRLPDDISIIMKRSYENGTSRFHYFDAGGYSVPTLHLARSTRNRLSTVTEIPESRRSSGVYQDQSSQQLQVSPTQVI